MALSQLSYRPDFDETNVPPGYQKVQQQGAVKAVGAGDKSPDIPHSLPVSLNLAKPWERTAALLLRYCRDPNIRNVGLEIERIGMWTDGYALHYQPSGARPGAEQLLVQLAKTLDWPIITYSEAFPLGLHGPEGKVSLEPGSQLEYSAAPTSSLGEAKNLVDSFEQAVEKLSKPWGLHWVGLGVNPVTPVDEMDVNPLTRYRIMTDYLSKQGTLATTMMRLTSSIQINFDYSSETEGIEMLRTGLAAAPLSYALFGNSPFSGGTPNGWLSFRAEVWRNMDRDRSGLMPEAFEEGYSFLRYSEMAWKRPLMFVQNKKGQNVASSRRSLQEVALGQLDDCEVNAENELYALRQVFTEARLKPGYVEVRSVDGLRPSERYGAIAFWVGLMYDKRARMIALDRLGTLSAKLRQELWVAASKEGLKAAVGGISMHALAEELLEASRLSLLKRGLGEEKFLVPVEKIVSEGQNPADTLLQLFHGPWKQDMAEVIRYCASASA